MRTKSPRHPEEARNNFVYLSPNYDSADAGRVRLVHKNQIFSYGTLRAAPEGARQRAHSTFSPKLVACHSCPQRSQSVPGGRHSSRVRRFSLKFYGRTRLCWSTQEIKL